MKRVMGEIRIVTREGVEELVKISRHMSQVEQSWNDFTNHASKGNHGVRDANADNSRTHWGLVACKNCLDSKTCERQQERSSCKRAIMGRVQHVKEKAGAEEKEEVQISSH
mmetsp:Transcript_98204/g.158340  ORF Transcript_98204/g.158340 Transcript_98204/m.158340 type:complete len:111 (-) Transcript_98204:505-837(-)